mgnify:FL=1
MKTLCMRYGYEMEYENENIGSLRLLYLDCVGDADFFVSEGIRKAD